jgi:hypothetical protein
MTDTTTHSPLRALWGAAIVVVLLHVLSEFVFVVRILEAPLVWLSTFAHEAGHGLAALAVGGRFEQLVIFWDASGVATHSGVPEGMSRAIVSAGGLIGPAVVAALLFAFGTRARLSRVGLALFALAMIGIGVLFVRNAFGLAFTLGCGALLAFAALRLSNGRAQTLVLFVAIQLSLSVFSRGDYLFTATAKTGAGEMPSDVAHVAEALGGSYLVWGMAIGALSVVILACGLGGVWLADKLHARARKA